MKSTFYTQGGGYGEKYVSTADMRVQDIAKLVRKDLKVFDGYTFSVKSSYNTIDVKIMSKPEGVKLFSPEAELYYSSGDYKKMAFQRYTSFYSPEMSVVIEKINKILTSYNYDDSDTQTDYYDVRFYKSVCVDWDLSSSVIKTLTK